MKNRRRFAVIVLVAALSLQVAPIANAAAASDRDDFGSKVIGVIKKFQQRIVGLISLDDFPTPPPSVNLAPAPS